MKRVKGIKLRKSNTRATTISSPTQLGLDSISMDFVEQLLKSNNKDTIMVVVD